MTQPFFKSEKSARLNFDFFHSFFDEKVISQPILANHSIGQFKTTIQSANQKC